MPKPIALTVAQTPVADVFTRHIGYLHLSGPKVRLLSRLHRTHFEPLCRVNQKSVTCNKYKFRLIGPGPHAIVLHAPGLDKFCAWRENLSFGYVVVSYKSRTQGRVMIVLRIRRHSCRCLVRDERYGTRGRARLAQKRRECGSRTDPVERHAWCVIGLGKQSLRRQWRVTLVRRGKIG